LTRDSVAAFGGLIQAAVGTSGGPDLRFDGAEARVLEMQVVGWINGFEVTFQPVSRVGSF
jgi:hypothetical protein